MPAEKLPMRKVREVLRLKYACGASERVIARSVGIGRTAVGEYIRRRLSASRGRWRSSSTTRRWSASCSRRPAITRRHRSRCRIGGTSMPSCAVAV
jgi:hypothetical protein